MECTPPPRWSDSALGQFCEDAHRNGYGIAQDWPRAWDILGGVMSMWETWQAHPVPESQGIAGLLRARAYGAYMAAVRLGLAGQNVESVVLARSVIENGVYAWWTAQSEQAAGAWWSRDESEEARKLCRRMFRWRPIIDALASADAELGEQTEREYQEAIDEGAHPNPAGAFANTNDPETIDGASFAVGTHVLHPGSLQQRVALKRTVAAGLLAHRILGRIWPDWYVEKGLERRARDLWRTSFGPDA